MLGVVDTSSCGTLLVYTMVAALGLSMCQTENIEFGCYMVPGA